MNAKMQSRYLVMLIIALSAALAVGCSSFPSQNSDPARNNKAAYNKDLKECQEDYPEAASGAYIRQWISCMKLKGWK
jgi:hypothetical protein